MYGLISLACEVVHACGILLPAGSPFDSVLILIIAMSVFMFVHVIQLHRACFI